MLNRQQEILNQQNQQNQQVNREVLNRRDNDRHLARRNALRGRDGRGGRSLFVASNMSELIGNMQRTEKNFKNKIKFIEKGKERSGPDGVLLNDEHLFTQNNQSLINALQEGVKGADGQVLMNNNDANYRQDLLEGKGDNAISFAKFYQDCGKWDNLQQVKNKKDELLNAIKNRIDYYFDKLEGRFINEKGINEETKNRFIKLRKAKQALQRAKSTLAVVFKGSISDITNFHSLVRFLLISPIALSTYSAITFYNLSRWVKLAKQIKQLETRIAEEGKLEEYKQYERLQIRKEKTHEAFNTLKNKFNHYITFARNGKLTSGGGFARRDMNIGGWRANVELTLTTDPKTGKRSLTLNKSEIYSWLGGEKLAYKHFVDAAIQASKMFSKDVWLRVNGNNMRERFLFCKALLEQGCRVSLLNVWNKRNCIAPLYNKDRYLHDNKKWLDKLMQEVVKPLGLENKVKLPVWYKQRYIDNTARVQHNREMQLRTRPDNTSNGRNPNLQMQTQQNNNNNPVVPSTPTSIT
jgi:hypothetical protein